MENYKPSSIERLRDGINQRPFKTAVDDLRITASIGVKYYRGDEEILSTKEMIRQASTKLEEAIDMGENSIAY
jgi:PleD family two-component response regulator